jgi:hypothetical protein
MNCNKLFIFAVSISFFSLNGMEKDTNQNANTIKAKVNSIISAIANFNFRSNTNSVNAKNTPIQIINTSQAVKKIIPDSKSISGTEFIKRLMSSVDDTTFFKTGDEINYTEDKQTIENFVGDLLKDALEKLPRDVREDPACLELTPRDKLQRAAFINKFVIPFVTLPIANLRAYPKTQEPVRGE